MRTGLNGYVFVKIVPTVDATRSVLSFNELQQTDTCFPGDNVIVPPLVLRQDTVDKQLVQKIERLL